MFAEDTDEADFKLCVRDRVGCTSDALRLIDVTVLRFTAVGDRNDPVPAQTVVGGGVAILYWLLSHNLLKKSRVQSAPIGGICDEFDRNTVTLRAGGPGGLQAGRSEPRRGLGRARRLRA